VFLIAFVQAKSTELKEPHPENLPFIWPQRESVGQPWQFVAEAMESELLEIVDCRFQVLDLRLQIVKMRQRALLNRLRCGKFNRASEFPAPPGRDGRELQF
jgi:hypothetical protein